MSVLATEVLVLNKSFLPVNITTVKRAFILLYQGIARVVDDQFIVFNFNDWAQLKAEYDDDIVGIVNRVIKVPRVIVLTAYDRLPKKHVRFSRMNIFSRDKDTCQYCGRKFARAELNIDHIIPRSLGGLSTWENVVCSCVDCNKKKGGRTPEQAAMKLRRKPAKPEWTPYSVFNFRHHLYKEWAPFLNIIDASYWNVELEM
ncbi:MAG: HNH endonuclease [Deltaproteobacteria bacterium]|nr:HNH endonuclease [Deltaproteobacteria bacterium]MCL5792559.1 HNH endonuclease [Deltaproteobacteria bacterium]